MILLNVGKFGDLFLKTIFGMLLLNDVYTGANDVMRFVTLWL